jgi:hypothetical protein
LPIATHHFLSQLATRSPDQLVFALPFDETRNTDSEKCRKVAAGLRSHFDALVYTLPIGSVGLSDVADFVPTTQCAFFVMSGADPLQVREELKRELYVPSKNRKTDVDRFRLEAHGYLWDPKGNKPPIHS